MLQQLTKESDLEALMKSPACTWLFKHSNTCSVSSAALDEVNSFLSAHPEQNVSMIVVQTHRPLSNAVASQLKHVHQSPQLFLLKDGYVLWSATHWSITADAMTLALKKSR
jgi:bacillithiol system protein YtxJ